MKSLFNIPLITAPSLERSARRSPGIRPAVLPIKSQSDSRQMPPRQNRYFYSLDESNQGRMQRCGGGEGAAHPPLPKVTRWMWRWSAQARPQLPKGGRRDGGAEFRLPPPPLQKCYQGQFFP